jgi:hypothetical protein
VMQPCSKNLIQFNSIYYLASLEKRKFNSDVDAEPIDCQLVYRHSISNVLNVNVLSATCATGLTT